MSSRPRRKRISKLNQLSKKVSKLSRAVETKAHFYSLTNTGVGTAGHLVKIDAIAQGDTSTTREGLFVTPSRFTANYLLESEVADAYNEFRVMVVQSKLGDLVVGDFPVNVASPLSHFNRSKFTVIYDKLTILNNIHSGDASDPLVSNHFKQFSISAKVRRKIFYPDASTNSYKGSLYLFMKTDSPVVNHPDMENFRGLLEFTDS